MFFFVSLLCALLCVACDDDNDSAGNGVVDSVYDFEVQCTNVCALYYGDLLDTGLGEECEFIISDKEFSEYCSTNYNSTNYRFTLITDFCGEDEKPQLREGVYKLSDDGSAMSISSEFKSEYLYSHSDGYDTIYQFVDVVITVSKVKGDDYKIELLAEDENGKTHHAVYNGPIDILDERKHTNLPTSTFTQDTEFDMSTAQAVAYYYGNAVKGDVDQWSIECAWKDELYGGDHVLFVSVFVPKGELLVCLSLVPRLLVPCLLVTRLLVSSLPRFSPLDTP